MAVTSVIRKKTPATMAVLRVDVMLAVLSSM